MFSDIADFECKPCAMSFMKALTKDADGLNIELFVADTRRNEPFRALEIELK